MQKLKEFSFFDVMTLILFYTAVSGQLIIPTIYVFAPSILEIILKIVGEVIKHNKLKKL